MIRAPTLTKSAFVRKSFIGSSGYASTAKMYNILRFWHSENNVEEFRNYYQYRQGFLVTYPSLLWLLSLMYLIVEFYPIYFIESSEIVQHSSS